MWLLLDSNRSVLCWWLRYIYHSYWQWAFVQACTAADWKYGGPGFESWIGLIVVIWVFSQKILSNYLFKYWIIFLLVSMRVTGIEDYNISCAHCYFQWDSQPQWDSQRSHRSKRLILSYNKSTIILIILS